MAKTLTRTQKWLLAIFLIAVPAGGAARLVMSSDWYAQRNSGALSVSQEKTAAMITVDVDGAVTRPGVYRLAAGSTLGAALDQAGGRARGADTRCINLTTELKDRQKIYIPYKSENLCQPPPPRQADILQDADPDAASPDQGAESQFQPAPAASGAPTGDMSASGAQAAHGPPGVININTATVQTLQTLPGIGPTYAQRIVELRRERGPFKTIEEIMLVKGIGEGTFSKFKHLIKVAD
jgi:competence protein ComEA